MKELENLKELYIDEIKRINKKGELTPADSDAAKKALDAIEKINMLCCEMEGTSMAYAPNSMMPMPMGYHSSSMMPDIGYSERRGRSSTTGRYMSRHNGGNTVNDMVRRLESMLSETTDPRVKMAIETAIDTLDGYGADQYVNR